MQAVNKRILIKAANLYYTDGVKQGEIAARASALTARR